jgi:hypothetical protein
MSRRVALVSSSETSVLTRATLCYITEDGILHSHRRENLKSYIVGDNFPKRYHAGRWTWNGKRARWKNYRTVLGISVQNNPQIFRSVSRPSGNESSPSSSVTRSGYDKRFSSRWKLWFRSNMLHSHTGSVKVGSNSHKAMPSPWESGITRPWTFWSHISFSSLPVPPARFFFLPSFIQGTTKRNAHISMATRFKMRYNWHTFRKLPLPPTSTFSNLDAATQDRHICFPIGFSNELITFPKTSNACI